MTLCKRAGRLAWTLLTCLLLSATHRCAEGTSAPSHLPDLADAAATTDMARASDGDAASARPDGVEDAAAGLPQWKRVAVPGAADVGWRTLAGSRTATGWIVALLGDDNAAYLFDGRDWQRRSIAPQVDALAVGGLDDIVAIGPVVAGSATPVFLQWNATANAWQDAGPFATVGPTKSLTAAWGPTDERYVAGLGSTLFAFDGSSWQAILQPADIEALGSIDFVSGSGSRRSGLFLAASGGMVVRGVYDNAAATWSWQRDMLETPVAPVEPLSIEAVWAAAEGAAFAVSNGGYLSRFDPATGAWAAAERPLLPLTWYAVWGLDATHVWAVGARSRAVLWNGSTWDSVSFAMPPGTPVSEQIAGTLTLRGIWADASDNVIAVSQQGDCLWYHRFE